jgi:hypothetical protein
MALPLETWIATLNGWRRMNEIQEGDIVFDETGHATRVRGVSPVFEMQSYQVSFSDGTELISDGDQRFLVWPYKARKILKQAETNRCDLDLVTVSELYKILSTRNNGTIRYSIHMSQALQYPKQELIIPPYVLGAWLGDGHSSQARFITADIEIIAFIREAGYPATQMKEKYKWTLTRSKRWERNGLQGQLATLNLLKNKHIPEIYLRSSVEQRTLLLHGLMDTDGSCSKFGHCSFANSNTSIIEAVFDLITSLGTRASIVSNKSLNANFAQKKHYKITFTPSFPVFRLPRKLARQNLAKMSNWRHFRYITSVEVAGNRAVKNLYLENELRLFLVSKNYLPIYSA